MTIPFSSMRRRVLMGLVSALPASQLLHPTTALAAPGDDPFLRVSRILTGTDMLSAGVAARIRGLLAARNAHFEAAFSELAETMQKAGGNRAQMLSRLSPVQVHFALTIAKPWYLGYVGKPSNFVLKDDAEFATFLEAQSFEKVIEFVPRPTYPLGTAGSWAAPPKGVDSPAMPEEIKDWTFHPGGPAAILAPDPEWRVYATASHPSMEEARKSKPGDGSAPSHA